MGARILTISKPYVAATYRDKLAQLEKLGFTSGLICPPAWGTQAYENDPPAPFWTRQVPIHFNGRNHFHWYRGLGAAVADFRPDLINCEEEHYSAVTWQVFRLAAARRIPVVFYTWQNIDKEYPPPFRWIERRVFRQAAAGVAGNQEAADILRRKGFGGPLEVIPQMGVEVERFAPPDSSAEARRARLRALGLDDGAFWIGFFGRLVEEKGIQDVIAAMERLRDRNLHPKLLVGGTGPFRDDLERAVATANLAGQVHFAGALPSPEVAYYLQAIDVLCLPSHTRANWKEQFGRVLIEAMAAEAVCLGSSSGEIPHVIGDAGRTFPEGDAPALAAALAELMESGDLLASLRQVGRERVRRHYANVEVARRFGTLFRACLRGPGTPPP